jgi:septal ring factor EnvC (AmiA/AmiB activator)
VLEREKSRIGCRNGDEMKRAAFGGFRLALLLGFIAAGGAVWAQGAKAPREKTSQELEEIKRQLDASRDREKFLKQDMTALAKQRAELNTRLIDAARKVQDSEAKLSAIEVRLNDLLSQEDVIRDSMAERHAAIAKLLAAMQRIGRQPPPAFVTRRDDALKMVRSAMLLASIYPEFKYQADNLAKELDELVAVETGIRAEQSAQTAETKQLSEERGNITWLLAEKKAKLEQHQVELTSVRDAAVIHAKTITRLEDLLKTMDKELAAAQLAAKKEQLAAKKKTVEIKPESKKVAFLSPGRIKPAVPFARTKGTVPLPVRGRRVRNFAASDEFGSNTKGISIETRAKAQVTSPADGWVVYAGDFRSYGQLLILNSGGGYHILLAGMKQIDVSPGQFVLAGEPVAAMGAAAPAGGEARKARPVLYVEFRKDGQPIDPGPWWAESSEKVQG